MSREAALQEGDGMRMYGVCLSVYEVRLLAQMELISDAKTLLIVQLLYCCRLFKPSAPVAEDT
jgi:hypothetical protein